MRARVLRENSINTVYLHRYGDKTPKSVVGRIFSIIWIQSGLVIMAIFMAHITSALTVLNLEMGLGSLAGKKVCERLLSIILFRAI